MAAPSVPPLQLTFVEEVIDTVTAVAGWVMLTVSVSVQPLASVTVTVYVPADRLVAVADEPPPLHA